MERFFDYITDTETSQLKGRSRQIASKLEEARSKLAPIVDDIILSAADLVQKGDNRFLGECKLSVEQCQDIVWASQILKEIQYQAMLDNRVYKWPNTDVIVNNVSVGYTGRADSSRGKTIVIDEATVVRLLEVYEQMGEVIQVFVNESNKQDDEDVLTTTTSVISVRETHSLSRSIRNASERFPSTLSEQHRSRSRSRSRSQSPVVSQTSQGEMRASSTSFREDINPAQIKSTLSVLIKSSSRDLNKQSATTTSVKAIERQEEPTHIYIKIQCCSDPSSDAEHGGAHVRSVVLPANCDNQSTPHYHIRLGGDPVTLKVDQNNVEEGAVYCINTGTDEGENDVRIVIKQCPECFSTVIGSTTQIKDMLGESHESVTLHGKTVDDEADLSYSTDEVYSDKSKSKSRMQMSRILDDNDETVIEMGDDSIKVSKIASGSRVEIKSRSQIEPRDPTTSNLNVDPSRSRSRPPSQTGVPTTSNLNVDPSRSRSRPPSQTGVPTTSNLNVDPSRSRSRPPSQTGVPTTSNLNVDPSRSRSRPLSQTGAASKSRTLSESRTVSGSRAISGTKTPSGSRILISQPHIDVLIDTENVDKSSVQFNGEDEPSGNFSGVKSSLDAIHSRTSSYATPMPSRSYVSPVPSRKRSAAIPLTRKRICSSMEFDVSTVQTRMRDRGVEHSNPHIVVELTKMGVDQILRACRPAKCCRKAILDERQRTGLPYCVSLKSLPLMANDVDVIQQSYDMSVRKIKNTINLSEVHKDTLAYYIGLGRDDFRPNINFPWVVPIYDVKFNYRRPIINKPVKKERFFVLKPNDQDKQYKSHEGKSSSNERFFILKKVSESRTSTVISEPKIQKRKKRKVKRKRKVQYNEESKTINIGNKNYLDTINKWNQSRGTFDGKYLPKSILDDIDQIFYKKLKETLSTKWEDPFFGFGTNKLGLIGSYPKSDPDFSHLYDPLAHLIDLEFAAACERKNLIAKCEVASTRNLLKSGDCSFWSACKILDDVLEKINIDTSFPACSNKSFSDTQFSSLERNRQFSMESFSTIWRHVSEKLFYTSSDVTIFLKRRQSMGKIHKTLHTPKISKIENKTDMYHISKNQEEKLIPSPQKKLEYYVSLVDGDLVWGNCLPLVPPNYNTYFNHDNITSGEDPPKPPTPVLGPPQAQNSEPVNILEPPTVSISEVSLPMETVKPIEKASVPNKTTYKPEDKHVDKAVPISSTPTRKSFESESPDHPWAPFLTSEASLPVVQEPFQKVEKVVEVEAPKPPKKEPVPVAPTACKSSSCKMKKKKPCGQGVVIDIRKSTSKGATFIDTRATGGRCNKEICELYKNKLLMPDKTPPKASKAESQSDNNKQYTVIGKNNIKIVIDSKNVSVTQQKCKKSNTKCSHNC